MADTRGRASSPIRARNRSRDREREKDKEQEKEREKNDQEPTIDREKVQIRSLYFVPETTKTIQNCCTFINRVSLFIGRPARCFSECFVTKADITGKIEIKPLFVSRNQSLMSNLFERMQSGSPFVWVIFLSRKLANELSWNEV